MKVFAILALAGSLPGLSKATNSWYCFSNDTGPGMIGLCSISEHFNDVLGEGDISFEPNTGHIVFCHGLYFAAFNYMNETVVEIPGRRAEAMATDPMAGSDCYWNDFGIDEGEDEVEGDPEEEVEPDNIVERMAKAIRKRQEEGSGPGEEDHDDGEEDDVDDDAGMWIVYFYGLESEVAVANSTGIMAYYCESHDEK
jgi:hypothetical protein